MKEKYLEVTYRKGRALAAYLYLPRNPDDKSVRTERPQQGFVVDYAADGRPIGIEFTAPHLVTLDAVNQILAQLGQEPITAADLNPVSVA